jgi:hypothetical protein
MVAATASIASPNQTKPNHNNTTPWALELAAARRLPWAKNLTRMERIYPFTNKKLKKRAIYLKMEAWSNRKTTWLARSSRYVSR